MAGLPWLYDDGGRAAAGFRGDAGDCVTRAVSIALGLDYQTTYDDLAAARTAWIATSRTRHARELRAKAVGRATTARAGIPMKVLHAYLADRGWTWTPTMRIGSGTTVHLRSDELPQGVVIARVTRHVCAVVGGTVHDTSDPSRDGTRAVYGYWQPSGRELHSSSCGLGPNHEGPCAP